MKIPCVFVEYPELRAFKCTTCSSVFGYEEDEHGGPAPHCGLDGDVALTEIMNRLNELPDDWMRNSKGLNK